MLVIRCSVSSLHGILLSAIKEKALICQVQKFAHKFANQNIFEKFEINQNLQTIPFKMMYNMSMLRHLFSNERWGGGAEPPRSLIL